jgi:hypothetical protein
MECSDDWVPISNEAVRPLRYRRFEDLLQTRHIFFNNCVTLRPCLYCCVLIETLGIATRKITAINNIEICIFIRQLLHYLCLGSSPELKVGS